MYTTNTHICSSSPSLTKPFSSLSSYRKLEKNPDLSANIPKKLSFASTYCTYVGTYPRRVILIAQSACQRHTGVAPDPHNGAWGIAKRNVWKNVRDRRPKRVLKLRFGYKQLLLLTRNRDDNSGRLVCGELYWRFNYFRNNCLWPKIWSGLRVIQVQLHNDDILIYVYAVFELS